MNLRNISKKNKKVGFLSNNIAKIDTTSRGEPSKDIRNLETKNFKIIKNEIKILKPNVILFATGRTRDRYIIEAFDNKIDFKHSIISINIDNTRVTEKFTENDLTEKDLKNNKHSKEEILADKLAKRSPISKVNL